jgi:hypothetical protein
MGDEFWGIRGAAVAFPSSVLPAISDRFVDNPTRSVGESLVEAGGSDVEERATHRDNGYSEKGE